MAKDLADMRKSFDLNQPLDIANLSANPFTVFETWFEQATKNDAIVEPNAFVLSTANQQGIVSSRILLLKFFDQDGFVFYTNYQSQKAQDIAQNANVSLCFPWYPMERQIIIQGQAEKVSREQSQAYFASRPKGSQIGAWVSAQSQVIDSCETLTQKEAQLTQQYANEDVPLPDFWGGYRARPQRIEFWQGQPSRLHDRALYTRQDGSAWLKQRLSP